MNQSVLPSIAAVMPAVRASGLLVSLCTITVPPDSTTFDEGGAPDPNVAYIDLAGHVDIPCMDAPIHTGGGGSVTEVKSMQDIQAVNLRIVVLDDYYPAIIPDYRAVVDGVVYDIVNAENDSQRQYTHLTLELRTI